MFEMKCLLLSHWHRSQSNQSTRQSLSSWYDLWAFSGAPLGLEQGEQMIDASGGVLFVVME